MNQLAMMLPVGEQGLAGMPQAAAAVPRGAPPDGTAFSLMLGEHLWTLPQSIGAGGDEAEGMAMPTAPASYDPQAVMQGLLAEIVNLAVDSAGGAEQLAGKLAARIRQALAELASGKPAQQQPQPASVSVDAATVETAPLAAGSPADNKDQDAADEGQQLQQLIASLLQMAKGAGPAPLTMDKEHGVPADTASSDVTAPVKAAQGIEQRATPALLAPLVRQVMQQLFAELNPAGGKGQLKLEEVATGPAQPAPVIEYSGAPEKQLSPQQPDAMIEFGNGASLPDEPAGGTRAVTREAIAAPLLGTTHTAKSPSVDWFNSQAAGRPDLQTAELKPLAQLAMPQAGLRLQSPETITQLAPQGPDQLAAPVGDLFEADIELPQAPPLKLAVSAVRSTALEAASRFDVTISDPQGGSTPVTVSMELSSIGPDRLYSGQEMQRISEAMERVLSGEKQAAVANPDRSVARPEGQPMLRGTVIPETDKQPTVNGPVRSTSPAGMPVQAAEPAEATNRGAVIPESDVADSVLPDEGKAARPDSLLSTVISRRDRGQSIPESETAVTAAGRGHAPLHPVDSIQPGGGPQLAAHPQVGQDVPQRLLQFSTPQVGTDVSGYALDEIRQQLMDKVSEFRNAGNGLYNLKLDLYPKELGRMIVNIAVRGDNVAMQVAVLNRGQRDQLQRSLDALRDSLEEDGLSVVDMRVLDISGGAGQQQAAG